jgi:hypothetical protein
LSGALWSRRTVADLIQLHTGRRLSPTTVGHYLARWNIATPSSTGQHPAALVNQHAAPWWLTWSRPVPKYLASDLMPPPGTFAAGPPAGQVGPWPAHVEALLARSARGDLLFLLSRTPWQQADLVDAGARLARTVGHPVHLVVRRWPTEQGEVLRRWAEAPGSELRLTLA